ncbi:hypothetical protein FLA105534_03610 [Flavobacterium bizetiae]|uniref:DUF4136 domain-containing protein n=1 Tax=Flavobacterium bizetiae TaxID=2704140 RepID=A0A6J4GT55_9FLAO|nr:hypothetical protein [Flavobacterium bizetiae]CAA9201472.1 hypothetical protein FLA105534_03610 [Flavobacterium bizetiae]CAD5342095.1 hypothetical protein FLA105535_02076 [Flavobacterium bizetiae]CAD5347724.1 hypothetical protein FLA105534_01682 [Flavobacterium bizetiae]
MKRIICFLFLFLLFSCNTTHYFVYSKNHTYGIDFSNGKWLVGEIEANPYAKDKLTTLVLKDFSEYLGERVKYSLTEKSLLLPKQVPLNPSKSTILELKKGASFDYYVNIKCKNAKNDLTGFEFPDHFYYKKQMSFAEVTLEVYDLNLGEIIYSQTSGGSIEDENSFTNKPTTTVIVGCYNKIINDIKKKSIKTMSK